MNSPPVSARLPRRKAPGCSTQRLAWRLLVALLGLLFYQTAASAQAVLPPFGLPTGIACAYNTSLPTLTDKQAGWVQCDSNGRLLLNGSFSASISGFTPLAYGTPFTATTGGVTSAAFTSEPTVVVSNTGTTNTAYCTTGAGATTSSQPIQPQSWFAFYVSGGITQISCITSASTTTINMAAGTGIPTGSGGGSSSAAAATVTGFIVANTSTLAVSTSTAGVALPAGGTQILVNNPTASTVNALLDTGATTPTAANSTPIAPGGCQLFNTNGTATRLDAIMLTGGSPSGTLTIQSGSGTPLSCSAGSISQGAPNTVANAWPEKITDGTNVVDVIPASTAPLLTNKALVVAELPPIYQLLSNATASGSAITHVAGGCYLVDIYSTGTFSTATVNIVITEPTSTHGTTPISVVVNSIQPISIGSDATVQATVTGGGSPTGLYAKLSGTNPGACGPPNQLMNLQATTSGGISGRGVLLAPAASTNATLISAGTHQLYKGIGCNYSATQDFYFHFTDLGIAPTPGSTAVATVRLAPRSGTANVCNPFSWDFMDLGKPFAAGIGFWVSAAISDTDTTAPSGTNNFAIEVNYK